MEVLLIAAVLLIAVLVFSSVRVVPQGAEYRLLRLGRPVQTLSPGLYLIVPFVDRTDRKTRDADSAKDSRG